MKTIRVDDETHQAVNLLSAFEGVYKKDLIKKLVVDFLRLKYPHLEKKITKDYKFIVGGKVP